MKSYNQSLFGKELGKTIKTLRQRHKLSQEQLRERAGFASGYISRLEAGEYSSPSLEHVYKLAKAFDMSLRDLLEFASMIPRESSFEACLRGEGATEEEVKNITKYKEYVLFESK